VESPLVVVEHQFGAPSGVRPVSERGAESELGAWALSAQSELSTIGGRAERGQPGRPRAVMHGVGCGTDREIGDGLRFRADAGPRVGPAATEDGR
jgi:hypothetical protein